jgi:ubiquinone/menaquinone biosynthesis C-methylase UbiE
MRDALNKEKLKAVNDGVARRYDFQHSFLTARSDQRGRTILVDKAVSPGDKVLDCGAGTGSTALLAARKIGTSGKVVLLDMSDGMLTVARQRVAQAGLNDGVEFKTGDMLDLPFEDGNFDVVLSTYSVCSLHDPIEGVMEFYRVVRPGGRIGVAHSTDPKTPLIRWLADKVERAVWLIPSISLGCRSVSVLPTLEQAGCKVIFKKNIGIPLWPFFVFVVQKPAT